MTARTMQQPLRWWTEGGVPSTTLLGTRVLKVFTVIDDESLSHASPNLAEISVGGITNGDSCAVERDLVYTGVLISVNARSATAKVLWCDGDSETMDFDEISSEHALARKALSAQDAVSVPETDDEEEEEQEQELELEE